MVVGVFALGILVLRDHLVGIVKHAPDDFHADDLGRSSARLLRRRLDLGGLDRLGLLLFPGRIFVVVVPFALAFVLVALLGFLPLAFFGFLFVFVFVLDFFLFLFLFLAFTFLAF